MPYSLVLVEDETIVRTAVERMVDWEAEGFLLAGCYPNGKAALDAIAGTPVDMVLTDIKMPVMDGLALLEKLAGNGGLPYAAILSAFDDFPLVKQAFRLGAKDYILKTELSRKTLQRVLRAARQELDARGEQAQKPPLQPVQTADSKFNEVLLRQAPLASLPLAEGEYVAVCFLLQDLYTHLPRFAGGETPAHIDSFVRLVSQFPQLKPGEYFTSYDATRFFLLARAEGPGRLPPIVEMVKKSCKTYLNMSATAGISRPFLPNSEAFFDFLEEAELMTTLRYVFGPGRLYGPAQRDAFNPAEALRQGARYEALVTAVLEMDAAGLEKQLSGLLAVMLGLGLEEARRQAVVCLFTLYYTMGSRDVELASKIGLDYSLHNTVMAMESQRQVYQYCVQAIRRGAEYLEATYDHKAPGELLRAKRYIDDHFTQPNMSAKRVAAHIGYHEKYFCTRFKQVFGKSYTAYLTALRIQAATGLLQQTDLRVYEVAEAVGYSNQEHFIRTFKRQMGATPLQYRGDVTKNQ